MASPIAQKLRFWERSWARRRAAFHPKNKVLVIYSANLNRSDLSAIELAFSFSSNPIEAVYVSEINDQNQLIDLLILHQAKYLLLVGMSLSPKMKRGLQYFGVAYLEVDRSSLPPSEKPENVIVERKLRKYFGHRHAIYVHKPPSVQMGVLLRAFAEAKRRHPDLLLLLTGASLDVLEKIEHGLLVSRIDDRSEKIQLADILFAEDADWQESWVACANLSLIFATDRELETRAEVSLRMGSAVVIYGNIVKKNNLIVNLERVNAIRLVSKPQNLAPALSQALEPEVAASMIAQAIEYFEQDSAALVEKIDALLAV